MNLGLDNWPESGSNRDRQSLPYRHQRFKHPHMKRPGKIVLFILTASLLTGCDFIKNAFTYKDKTEALVEAILKQDYDGAVGQLAMDHEMAKNADVEALKKGFSDFREVLISNFGTDLHFSFMKAEKTFSTDEVENTPPNTTTAEIEFSNDKEFGVLKVLFDDTSGKILKINALEVKQPIPSMTFFWLFGLLAIVVPIFNIYVIRQVKRSQRNRKWLKYLAIVVFNVPAITYTAVGGLSVQPLNFQILLGISFSYMGYLNSAWTFGLPLGGLYWFWRLRQKERVVETQQVVEQ